MSFVVPSWQWAFLHSTFGEQLFPLPETNTSVEASSVLALVCSVTFYCIQYSMMTALTGFSVCDFWQCFQAETLEYACKVRMRVFWRWLHSVSLLIQYNILQYSSFLIFRLILRICGLCALNTLYTIFSTYEIGCVPATCIHLHCNDITWIKILLGVYLFALICVDSIVTFWFHELQTQCQMFWKLLKSDI